MDTLKLRKLKRYYDGDFTVCLDNYTVNINKIDGKYCVTLTDNDGDLLLNEWWSNMEWKTDRKAFKHNWDDWTRENIVFTVNDRILLHKNNITGDIE